MNAPRVNKHNSLKELAKVIKWIGGVAFCIGVALLLLAIAPTGGELDAWVPLAILGCLFGGGLAFVAGALIELLADIANNTRWIAISQVEQALASKQENTVKAMPEPKARLRKLSDRLEKV
ncbi:MAG: hypothetical protein ACYTEQ_23090 [Planctomycetota bacterium]|jgi:hypothetical protein